MDTKLGGWPAAVMFVVSLAGYVVQSQFTEYVQTDLHYRQPVFIFFSLIFPLHLCILARWTHTPARAYIAGLKDVIHERISPLSSQDTPFPTGRFLRTILLLTIGITCPGLLWYVAVSMTAISDVTAILNTNAFWAYLLSVLLASAPWQPRRLWAVLIAVLGVFLIVYGGSKRVSQSSERASARALAGDVLTLLASILYAVYQTTYKRYVALPNRVEPPAIDASGYEPIPSGTGSALRPPMPVRTLSMGSEVDNVNWSSSDEDERPAPINRNRAIFSATNPEIRDVEKESVYPSFGLHPNFITSSIGLATLLFLWPLMPLLHYAGLETFRWPDNSETWFGIAVVSVCGVAYNVGFMILLSIWGPTLATVGNMLTIVLVLISDTLFGHGLETLTLASLLGAFAIVLAFGVLVREESKGVSLPASIASNNKRGRSGSVGSSNGGLGGDGGDREV